MQRTATAHLDLTLRGQADLAFIVAAADRWSSSEGRGAMEETLTVTHDGAELTPREIPDLHGTRMHHVRASAGHVVLDYTVTVTGEGAPEAISPADLIRYVRPSRYCQSDELWPTAAAEFRGLEGLELIDAVTGWVRDRLSYVPGSSLPTDGATETMLARRGVCRDYAHLVIALLRARDVPTRLAAVYAPGLTPMDFHAIAEAYVDGAWYALDATDLAPRRSMVRIATGRDAADTAFLSNAGAEVILNQIAVTAVADELPADTSAEPVRLA
ncbi:MAG: transglutaminase family protein [Nesterenkonia sp.]|uniref:transglutaminase-like domain-containing protein n=1 Tax=Nesterenkonia marinintestina TaxID=2979865 RepID=UPI0021BFCA8C|nr:transglutaminase family protein [Nesterenkonia sp. GX14115]MDO5493037.1 transglutaminase family protein [Nesterenkonia sp.]